MVWDYPGRGEHEVLFTFGTTNKLGDAAEGDDTREEVAFNQKYRTSRQSRPRRSRATRSSAV